MNTLVAPQLRSKNDRLKSFIKDSISSKIEKLDGLAKNRNHDYPIFESFEGWLQFASQVEDSDQARYALYYGFQPMYDALIENTIQDDGLRLQTLNVMQKIIAEGQDFITQYYFGQSDHKKIVELTQSVGDTLKRIEKYYYKKRNIDTNYIYPHTIGVFIKKYLLWITESKTPVPDTIICCACGPTEIAMALAGIIKCDINFIRRSHRRGDSEPKIIKEHEESIRKMCNKKNVLVLEDYVCTGNSIFEVMKYCKTLKPSSIYGACINGGTEYDAEQITSIQDESKLHVFIINKNSENDSK